MKNLQNPPHISFLSFEISQSFFSLFLLIVLDNSLEYFCFFSIEEPFFYIVLSKIFLSLIFLFLGCFFLSMRNPCRPFQILFISSILVSLELSIILKEPFSIDPSFLLLKGFILYGYLFQNNQFLFTCDYFTMITMAFLTFYTIIRLFLLFGNNGFFFPLVEFSIILQAFVRIRGLKKLFHEQNEENSLLNEDNYNSRILKSLPYGVFAFTDKGKIIYTNSAFEDLIESTNNTKNVLEFDRVKKQLSKFHLYEDFMCGNMKGLNLKLVQPKNARKFMKKINTFQKSLLNLSYQNSCNNKSIINEDNHQTSKLGQDSQNNVNAINMGSYIEDLITLEKKSYNERNISSISNTLLKNLGKSPIHRENKTVRSQMHKSSIGNFKISMKNLNPNRPLMKYKRIFLKFWIKVKGFFSLNLGEKRKKTNRIIAQDSTPFNLVKEFYIAQGSEHETQQCTVFRSEDIYLITMSRVTEAPKVKETLQEMKDTQSKIIASLAHELKTPLNGMGPLFETLKSSVSELSYQNELYPLIATHQNLNLIVNDYLDFSKIYLGTFQLTYSIFNLEDLIKNTLQFVSVAMHCEEKLVFKIDIDERIAHVRSDQTRVSQILYNLIANALKYTKEGSIIIKASLMENLPMNFIRISVEDTGCGIHPRALRLLGTLNSKATNNKLAGIGLTISNYIAQKLAPKELAGLFVNSEEGKGSKFFFLLENFDDKSDDNSNESLTLQEFEEKSPKYSIKPLKILQTVCKTIEEEDEKPSFPPLLLEIANDSPTSLDYKTLNHTILPHNALNYLSESPFKNKFVSKPPQIFTLTMDSSQLKSSYLSKGMESLLKPTSLFSNKKLPTSPKLETWELSFNDPSLIEDSVLLLKTKIEEKGCICPDILIVDDQFFNIKAFEMISKQLPFILKIDCADSGDLAIKKVKSFYEESLCGKELKCYGYKCIFMDYDMPNKNGVITTKELKAFFREKNYNTPVVPWTAFDDKNSRKECKSVGMVDFLGKPFNGNQLKKILIKRILPQYI